MATRIYKDPADFDARQGHFTIEVVDRRYYLRIGALNSEDRRLIGSLIDDGFVGFFQDDVRIGIAGIDSIYDAENDRIEIDRELPELQIEDAYIIRFTQARPGDDGDGGIGTPGEDGEHAEIEIEDTDTGIRVRGKSGGEPAFGPWQDVRDGIDGQDGKDGDPGEDGDDGWTPILAVVTNGERRVHRVVDWTGGEGTKPATGQYVGENGFVTDVADATDIRGPAGEDGDTADPCETVVLINDPAGARNVTDVQLGNDFRDYEYLHVEVGISNQSRINSIPVATLRNNRDYRIAGVSVVRFVESADVRRNFIQIFNNGNFRYVALSRCIPLGTVPDHTHDLPDHTHPAGVAKTRGPLVATSSFLPQQLPGSMREPGYLGANRITWGINSNQYGELISNLANSDFTKITAHSAGNNRGILYIPFFPPENYVDGLWVVCEDLDDVDTEIWSTKLGWNPRGIDISASENYFTEEIPLHFGQRDDESPQRGDDVVLLYYKGRGDAYKPGFNVQTYGGRLPSARCRIKVYLAGIFLTTE